MCAYVGVYMSVSVHVCMHASVPTGSVSPENTHQYGSFLKAVLSVPNYRGFQSPLSGRGVGL